MKKIVLLASGVALALIASFAIAAPAVTSENIQQALCFGKNNKVDAYPVYDNPAQQYQSRPILGYWFARAIEQAKRVTNNTIFVPAAALVSPDKKKIALLTADYSLDTMKNRQDFCKYPNNTDPDPVKTSIFIISNGKIKQFPFKAVNGANYAASWNITGWQDNFNLNLKTNLYDPGAGFSCINSDFSVLDTEKGKWTKVQYVRGVRDGKWYILTADPSVMGKETNTLYCGPGDGYVNAINFFLLNASTSKYTLIHTIDISRQLAKNTEISAAPPFSKKLIGKNSIIRTINTAETFDNIDGLHKNFLIPEITRIQKKEKGLLIQYKYKLNEKSSTVRLGKFNIDKKSPTYSSTFFIKNNAWEQLKARIGN
jgi:hypothetical protein